jgi:hypothetical protein
MTDEEKKVSVPPEGKSTEALSKVPPRTEEEKESRGCWWNSCLKI